MDRWDELMNGKVQMDKTNGCDEWMGWIKWTQQDELIDGMDRIDGLNKWGGWYGMVWHRWMG